jgi:hypothetical protein
MIRKPLVLWSLCSLFALVVAPALRADDDHHRCSLRNVSGDWGFTTNGTRIGVGPVAGAGVFTLDKNGNILDGAQTVSFNGTVADETFSGTYTVNDDCTGQATVVVASPIAPRTSHLNLVFVGDSNAVRMIFTDAGTILTVDGRKVDPH